MDNGYINEVATIKRNLILAVDRSLYPHVQGQTDTEVLFHLVLTLGLEDSSRCSRSLRQRAADRLRTARQRRRRPE